MAKRESNFINMVSTLLIITLISAVTLGLVKNITEEPIRVSRKNRRDKAIKAVLPEYDKLGESYKVKPEGVSDSIEIFPALDADGKEVAAAIKSFTNNGFSGYISIMVGVNTEGQVTGYSVLQHKETPGLGTKMGSWFNNEEKPSRNVIGKSPEETNLTVSKDGGDIDAISGATISSRAFLEAINLACKIYKHDINGLTSATSGSDNEDSKKEV